MHLRHALIRTRRGLMLLALLCILLARMAVPAGWMPVVDAAGKLTLAPCSGMGATRIAVHVAPAMAMPGMATHHADPGKDEHHPDPSGDHPCSGAGVSVALDVPTAAPTVAIAARAADVKIRPFLAAIGRGLAAPPPPQTGPPLLA